MQHSRSLYCSPVVIVPKPDGRFRLVSDLRELNKVTKPDAYPLPLIADLFLRVSKGKVFALIDLKDGFYQIQLSSNASEMCAIVLPFGLYEFTRLVMGWTNAPSEFQRKINEMLNWGIAYHYILEDTIEAYIDDLLVYAQDMATLFDNVNRLIKLLLRYNMAIIPSKCHFGVKSAKYLGFILVPGGKTLSTQITNRIKEKLHNIWTEGCNETDKTKVIKYTQRIIGTLVYFQQFIPRFTVKARFLFNKLSTGSPYTQDDIVKLQEIIDKLAEHHTIYTPCWQTETEVFTDASNYHMGYAAFQNHKIVDLGSKKLQTKKVIASTIEREMATIKYAINRLTPMIDLKKATIFTDHNPILGILKSPLHKLPNALATIVDEITRSQVTISYVKGKNNILADALSRRTCLEEPTKKFQINYKWQISTLQPMNSKEMKDQK